MFSPVPPPQGGIKLGRFQVRIPSHNRPYNHIKTIKIKQSTVGKVM